MLPLAPAIVLTPTYAIIAAIVVVVAVILVWKLAKFALKIGVIVAAAVILFFVLRAAGVL